MSDSIEEPVTGATPGLAEDYGIYSKFQDPIQTAIPEGEAESSDGSLDVSEAKYPSWCIENGSMFSENEIFEMFNELQSLFKFQYDNMMNMYDFFMTQLESRSSRMSCPMALLSLHVNYIGGDSANFKKWYFAAQIDETSESADRRCYKNYHKNYNKIRKNNTPYSLGDLDDENSLLGLEYKWKLRMNNFKESDYVYQIALWLLIWGEANNVRFMPECLCFLYQCAFDCFYQAKQDAPQNPLSCPSFLEGIIDPLYNYIRDQQYELVDQKWRKNEQDHDDIIGYDDMNQAFWYSKNLRRIKLLDGRKLLELPKEQRYANIHHANWNKFFRKTFYEKRSWLHAFSNFSRVWTIHISVFWYYTVFNSPILYTKNYDSLLDNPPASQVQWTMVSLGGAIACLITLFAAICELSFVPRKFPGSRPLLGRLIFILLTTIINIAPTVYILYFLPWDKHSRHGIIIGIVQFVVSLVTFLYFAIESPSKLFNFILGESSNQISSQSFISSYPKLARRSQAFSYLLWICVFVGKFSESYFFLTLSLKDPLRILFIMDMTRCHGDIYLGSLLCRNQAKITSFLLVITNLVLFFLDTYLWYIICNCVFSIGLSFSVGISIFTPWKNIFLRLPDRIRTKLIYSSPDGKSDISSAISHVWNTIILAMYRDHLISIQQVNKLVYQQTDPLELKSADSSYARSPLFFMYQGDNSVCLNDFFPKGKDAERRLSFFAQSLSIPLNEPSPVSAMPSFTVLIPHYSEKIILGLKETIRENKNTKVSLLDYLKELYKSDWECFVSDSKIVQSTNAPDDPPYIGGEGSAFMLATSAAKEDPEFVIKNQIDDLPYYCIGFKDSSPEYTLRTRLWASLRYQTLYRTISGFMNYEAAIKILASVENYDICTRNQEAFENTSRDIDNFTKRKFNLLLAMQRYQYLSGEELNDAHFLFKTFPNLRVAYLEEETDETGQSNYYSTLLDISQGPTNGKFETKYRIKLSGNPILGDGKSDNQNHALIFYRGEYIQVIDANQDNYLEECLKIKTVLAEFEEMTMDMSSEYVPGTVGNIPTAPVAILGAREYIFSESIGILGDIAAAKEQTFGTLFSRTMAEIGGKLHYGHPDFLNGIFMSTRGGLSKAQKGLHLNEDIYAGMTVVCRGGRIKHCDYYQCGKGRDLGFGTILNFTTKIGAGMGEQILSREHYYLGTHLPIDRFLTFYYAHPGFHINNLFIMLSIQFFMLVLLNLGALKNESILCTFDPNTPITEIPIPLGCYNLIPVMNWITRFVLSIFICFFISFLPLIVQELVEKGFIKAILRVLYHFLSLAPFFEVFVCQIYANSLRDNLIFGGARYIATGRGFAVTRESFASLYSKYAESSIYSGTGIFLIIIFATITIWSASLLWFSITIVSMCLAPFLFNPHQFVFGEFFLDYRDFIRWLSRGNGKSHNSSWIGFTRSKRSRITGHKRNSKIGPTQGRIARRPSRFNAFIGQVLVPLIRAIFYLIPFMFLNSQNGVSEPLTVNPLLRILVSTFVPYAFNSIILVGLWTISLLIGVTLGCCCNKSAAIIAAVAHCLSVLISVANFQSIFFLEGWSFARSLCGIIFVIEFQNVLSNLMLVFFLSRELEVDYSNSAWWSGKWYGTGLGWLAITQPLREFVVKVFELNSFAQDLILGHCLFFAMSPFLLLPLVDKWHSSMLFWLKPSKTFRNPIYSKVRRRKRKTQIFTYASLFLLMLVLSVALIIAPLFIERYVPNVRNSLPSMIGELIQPNHQHNNDTGPELAPLTVPRGKPTFSPMETVA